MKKLIFDIEADGLTPTKLWCIVAKELDGTTHTFNPDQLEQGKEFLQTADVLIGHNIIGYDIPVLERLIDFKYNGAIEDTLVMSRLFNPVRENGHSLKTWGYRVGFHKQEQPEDFDSYTPKMLEYCTRDVQLNEVVYKKLLDEGRGFSDECLSLEHDVAKIISDQEKTGFLFNEKEATLLLAKLKDRMVEVEDEVHRTFKPKWVDVKKVIPKLKKDGTLSKSGLTNVEYAERVDTNNTTPFMRKELQDFNLGSRKQIGEYLTDFGWKPERFTPTGQPIVDEGTLKKIEHIHEAKLIAEFLLLQKRIAQITSWMKELKDDRVHGHVIPNGTITGRMSHYSPNMAQIPAVYSPYGKECRSCWIVPEGYKLVGIDASGLELRVLAHYMGDTDYIHEVVNGDIHSTNQDLAGLDSRDKAKTFIYALVYGAGDAKIGSIIGESKEGGSKLKKTFLTNLPALKNLTTKVQQAARRGYLKGLDGRKIWLRHKHAALNTLLQGCGAIVMKKALILFDDMLRLQTIPAKIVGNIHDEWQVEVPEKQAEHVGALAVRCIEQASKEYNLRCPLTGEYKIGDSWNETH